MTDVFRFAEERFLLVGKVAKPHGLRGEVKVHPYADDPQSLTQYDRAVLVDKAGRLSPALPIEKARIQGKAAIIKFAAVVDRSGAEELHGMGMLIFKEDLAAVDDDEYYWYQLYNLPVSTEDGVQLGSVRSIFSNGVQDIMVVADGNREYLIPILAGIVKEYDDEGIVIAPPPGLLEMNDGSDEDGPLP